MRHRLVSRVKRRGCSLPPPAGEAMRSDQSITSDVSNTPCHCLVHTRHHDHRKESYNEIFQITGEFRLEVFHFSFLGLSVSFRCAPPPFPLHKSSLPALLLFVYLSWVANKWTGRSSASRTRVDVAVEVDGTIRCQYYGW